MGRRAQTPLGRYANLRAGGNLPQYKRTRFPGLLIVVLWLVASFCVTATIDKAIGHHTAISCGAC